MVRAVVKMPVSDVRVPVLDFDSNSVLMQALEELVTALVIETPITLKELDGAPSSGFSADSIRGCQKCLKYELVAGKFLLLPWSSSVFPSSK